MSEFNPINHYALMDQIRHHETSHLRHDPFSHVSLEGRASLKRSAPVDIPMSRPIEYEPEGTTGIIEKPYLTDANFGKTIIPTTTSPDISAAPVYKEPILLEEVLKPVVDDFSVIPEEPKLSYYEKQILPKINDISVIPEEPKLQFYEREDYLPAKYSVIPEEPKLSYDEDILQIVKPVLPKISEFSVMPDEPEVKTGEYNFYLKRYI